MIKTLTATRYVTPLREGSSLPAIVETAEGALYVMKFRGAGQGPKALIAELVAGEIGRALGLSIPDIALIELDPRIGRSEGDPEIQELIQASAGLNLGLRYLPQAFEFNALLKPAPAPALASTIVWFDAYVTNVDRTARNVNLLLWQEQLWLIDHGAALYMHHAWKNYLAHSRTAFRPIKDHTLLPFATLLDQVDAELRQRLSPALIRHIIDLIPESWLAQETRFANQAEHRQAYVDYLTTRLEASAIFVEEARHAQAQLV